MFSKWTKMAVIGLVVVMVMSVGALAVFAQADDTETPDDTPTVPFGHGFRDFAGDRLSYLADALGITTSELEAAQQQAHAAQLSDAVEQGLITQDQANLMLAMQALKSTIDQDALMAQVLGITVEELQAAKEDGTLRDLLNNITPADLQEKMQAAFESAVAQAVADKVITQEQADLVLENGLMGLRGFGHGGFGGHRGPGGFRGHGGFPGAFGNGMNNALPNAAAPSA